MGGTCSKQQQSPIDLRKALQQRAPAAVVWQRQLDVALDEAAQRALILHDTGLQSPRGG